MPDHLSDLTRDLRNRKIEAPESFADDIMGKIALQKEGGFRSLPVPLRIVVSAIVITIYCSLGILLGIKGYENLRPDTGSSHNKELVELMKSHYMSPDFFEDPIFARMNSKN